MHTETATAKQRVPPFGREKELASLRERFSKRGSFLFHGPTGVGKTFLLQLLLPEFPAALYCPDVSSKQTLFRELGVGMLRSGHAAAVRVLKSEEAVKAKSSVSLKGLVLDLLKGAQFTVLLDHLKRPSAQLAADVRDVHGWGTTPIIGVARSAHMEDIGHLMSLFADRSQKVQLNNFDPSAAARFVSLAISASGLAAENLEEVSRRILEFSAGNPGAILAMIDMAKSPRYRADNYVKITPLYVDFRLSWSAESMG